MRLRLDFTCSLFDRGCCCCCCYFCSSRCCPLERIIIIACGKPIQVQSDDTGEPSLKFVGATDEPSVVWSASNHRYYVSLPCDQRAPCDLYCCCLFFYISHMESRPRVAFYVLISNRKTMSVPQRVPSHPTECRASVHHSIVGSKNLLVIKLKTMTDDHTNETHIVQQ